MPGKRRKIICTEDHKGHKDNPFDPNGLRLEPNLDGSAQRTEVPLEYGALEFETINESLPFAFLTPILAEGAVGATRADVPQVPLKDRDSL